MDARTKVRRDYWLGPFGTPASRELYHRLIAEWESNGRSLPPRPNESPIDNGLWVRDLIHNTQAGLNPADQADDLDPDADDAAGATAFPEMECQPFEHHDYVMLMFQNDQDFHLPLTRACQGAGV